MFKKVSEDLEKALKQDEKEIDFSDFGKSQIAYVEPKVVKKEEIKLNKKELKESLDIEIKQECRMHIYRAMEDPIELENQSMLLNDVQDAKVDARDIDMVEIAKEIYETIIGMRKYDKFVLDATRAVKFDRDYVMQVVMECCAEECKNYEKSTKLEEDIDFLKGKKMPVGTVSNGMKKVAEGKWVHVTQGQKESDKKQSFKDIVKEDMKKKGLSEEAKEIKSLVKHKFKDKFGGYEIQTYVKHNTSEEVMSKIQDYMNTYKKGDVLFTKVFRAPDLSKKSAIDELHDLVKDNRSFQEDIDIIKGEKLTGGKGDNQPDKKYSQEQLKLGIQTEMEHTDDQDLAKEIAKDHLEEDSKYYDHLIAMEKKTQKSTLMEDIDFIKGGPGSGKKQGYVANDSEKVVQRQAAAKKKEKEEVEKKEKQRRHNAAMAKLMMDLVERKMKKAEEVVDDMPCDCDSAANCKKCNKKPCEDAADGCVTEISHPLANQADIITS